MGILKTPWERQYRAVWKREDAFLRRYSETPAPSKLDSTLSQLTPEPVQAALSAAFEKAFLWIFERGISRKSPSAKRQQRYQMNRYALGLQENRTHLRAFHKASAQVGRGAALVSGVSGVGMGLLGVVLPDVPLFTALLLNSVADTAACFGYDLTSSTEQVYALRVIQAALSDGDSLRQQNHALDVYAQTGAWPDDVDRREEISAAARQLSQAMLRGKLVQNVPVVGAAGGIADAVCLRRVQQYAALKYEKRFLIRLRTTAVTPQKKEG